MLNFQNISKISHINSHDGNNEVLCITYTIYVFLSFPVASC